MANNEVGCTPSRDEHWPHDSLLKSRLVTNAVANDGLDNFRDITSQLSDSVRLDAGKIYRCAHPRKLTPEGVNRLLEQYCVKSLLDLRSAKEVEQYKSLMDQHFEQGLGRRRYFVPLWSDVRAVQALWGETPMRNKMRVLGHLVTGSKQGAIDVMMGPLKGEGLFKMNQFFLEYSKREICRALQICADPSNHPVLIFCSLGKDRTGITTALLLLALQVPRQDIVRDYTSTRITPETLLTSKRALEKAGLDPEVFCACGEGIMQKIFQYLDWTYGSPEAYLDGIGFHAGWRNLLREAMTGHNKRETRPIPSAPPLELSSLPPPLETPKRAVPAGRESTSLPSSPISRRANLNNHSHSTINHTTTRPTTTTRSHHSSLQSVHDS